MTSLKYAKKGLSAAFYVEVGIHLEYFNYRRPFSCVKCLIHKENGKLSRMNIA